MKSLHILFLLAVTVINGAAAMDNPSFAKSFGGHSQDVGIVDLGKKGVVDLRTLWIDCPHNKQDMLGTFLHNLAHESAEMRYKFELDERCASFKQYYKDLGVPNPIVNPFILNRVGRTARQEAKIVFNTSGNAVTHVLIQSLRKAEESFANVIAESEERFKAMDKGQQVQEQDKMYTRS